MSKFKAGDVVLIRGGKDTPDYYGSCIGKTGVVVEYSDIEDGHYDDDFVWHNEHWVVVKLDKPYWHKLTLWTVLHFFEHELELLDENR